MTSHALAIRRVVSQAVEAIPPSGIRKYFDLVSTMRDVISLGVGEPDFSTPWHISQHAVESLQQGETSYTSNYGLIELRRLLSNHLEHRYQVSYDPTSELLITIGVSEALDLALRAILDPGDEVLIPDPSYVSYVPCTILSRGIPVPIATQADEHFIPDPARIAAAITPRTKAIILGYPNNPTGGVAPRAILEKIARIAAEHDLIVISDEIYDRLVYGQEHTCVAGLPGMRDRTILLGGFSKAYAMTGWRVGYAAAPPELVEAMMKVHQYTVMCAPTQAQIAAIEALRSGEPDVQRMVAEYDRRRRVIVKGLNDLGLTCFEPKGAFYAFPCIASTGLTSEQFAEGLLQEERVLVVPGNVFGACGEGYVRCSYAASLPKITEALARIERFIRCH
jgi:aminotransferase